MADRQVPSTYLSLVQKSYQTLEMEFLLPKLLEYSLITSECIIQGRK